MKNPAQLLRKIFENLLEKYILKTCFKNKNTGNSTRRFPDNSLILKAIPALKHKLIKKSFQSGKNIEYSQKNAEKILFLVHMSDGVISKKAFAKALA